MALQTGLFSLLAANAGVTALIDGAIYAGEAPDQIEAYPCVAYKLVAGVPAYNFDNGYVSQRVELNGHSFNSYAEADAIRSALLAAVDGWKGLQADGTLIDEVEIINVGTDFVTEQRCFRCMAEIRVVYA